MSIADFLPELLPEMSLGWEPAVETAPEGASRRETRLHGLGSDDALLPELLPEYLPFLPLIRDVLAL